MTRGEWPRLKEGNIGGKNRFDRIFHVVEKGIVLWKPDHARFNRGLRAFNSDSREPASCVCVCVCIYIYIYARVVVLERRACNNHRHPLSTVILIVTATLRQMGFPCSSTSLPVVNCNPPPFSPFFFFPFLLVASFPSHVAEKLRMTRIHEFHSLPRDRYWNTRIIPTRGSRLTSLFVKPSWISRAEEMKRQINSSADSSFKNLLAPASWSNYFTNYFNARPLWNIRIYLGGSGNGKS